MSRVHRKTVVCLLHIPKAAGSSVWHTLAALPENCQRQGIGVADTYYEARRILKSEDPLRVKREAVVQFNRIIDEYLKSDLDVLFLHHHTPGLPTIRRELDYDFICVVRKPQERLESAVRHWLGGIMDKQLVLDPVVDLTAAISGLVSRGGMFKWSVLVKSCVWRVVARRWIGMPFSFFGSFVSYGADSYMRESFGPRWRRRRNCGMPSNARMFCFNTDDLMDAGLFAEWFGGRYGFGQFNIRYFEGTATERGRYYVVQEQLMNGIPGFRSLFRWRIRVEGGAVSYLLSAYRPKSCDSSGACAEILNAERRHFEAR